MRNRFRPGVDRVLYTQAVYGKEEINAVVQCLKDGWLGPGKYTAEFEGRVAKLFGKKYGLFVNSGSSANYIALEIAKLPKGSEIIAQACTFPTTLNPIIQHGYVPVFVDSRVGNYNIDIRKLERAIGPRTKAIFISHTIGNINDMARIRKICDQHKLLFIEDACDTIASKFRGEPTGRWSDIVTTSFYAAHNMTAGGGGGMVMTDDKELIREAKICRDWGRALPENEDENIEERFSFKVGGRDFDGKFTHVKIAHNFKPVEMQAAFGLAQLKKLPRFNRIRAHNFKKLYNFFKRYEHHFILPQIHPEAESYLIAFPLTIRKASPIKRKDLLTYLEKNHIQTRLLFTGNILHQPAYHKIRHRLGSSLNNADYIMDRSFLVGTHHGLTDAHVQYMMHTFERYLNALPQSA
ncbi:aminotransferase class I/II-fold pyridoxal phosphate-dependent enzyme [Candidatus Parcubacteria bacterium]|nr:aminotransferase class I/II-fold pyridoxal phosphate-dependent enzyme [Candidatus Parcubacteria bacterium]